MVQTRTLEFVYDFPWELVILAYEDKFWHIPDPELPDVLEVRFLDFSVDDSQVCRFSRWGAFALNVPAVIMRLAGGPESVVFNSTTDIDRKGRVLRTVGENETFRSRLEMDETTTFRPHPEDPNKTILTLEARMEIKVMLLGLAGTVERIIISRYETLSHRGREIEKRMIATLSDKLAHLAGAYPLTRAEQIATGVVTLEAALAQAEAERAERKAAADEVEDGDGFRDESYEDDQGEEPGVSYGDDDPDADAGTDSVGAPSSQSHDDDAD